MQTNGEEPTAKRQRTGETQYEELLTLGNPPTGFLSIYNKSGVMYVRDDTGVESQLGAGGAASEPPQYGELAGSSTVACTVQNTFYQVSSLTAGLTSGFSAVGSTLVYTGPATAPFKVACSFSMETDTKNNTYDISAFVNGVQDPQSTASRYISNNDVGSASFAGLFTLSPGDVVEAKARCTTSAGTTLTFTAVNLTIIGIGGGAGGTGDVSGPASATDNAIARYNLGTGKIIKDSGVTIDDTGFMSAGNMSAGNTTVVGTFQANSTSTMLNTLSSSNVAPRTNDTYDLGSAALRYKDCFVAQNLTVGSSGNDYTFPIDTRGVNGQVLTTNGSGVVTWQTPSGGGSTAPTQGTLIRDTPYDPVDVDDAVTFEFTVGNQPVGIGTITSGLFSCTTGNVAITDMTGVYVDTDLLNRVFTIEAQFDTPGTQTLSFDNTASANMRNALGDAFLACTADVDVVVNAITLSTDLYTLVMSGDSAPPPWVAEASTNDSGATGAWQAFANAVSTDSWISNLLYDNPGTYLGSNLVNGVVFGEAVYLTNSLGNFYNPTTYTLAGRANAGASIVMPPRTWTIFATTDYTSAVADVTTWEELDSRTDVALEQDYTTPITYTIPPANRFPFRRVVIVVQALHAGGAGGGHKAGIMEWTFDDA